MKFTVDETLMTYLEALHFDVKALENIMKDVVKDNCNKYTTDVYDYFRNDYVNTHRKYEYTKSQILEEFVPIEHRSGTFSFNFIDCYVEIMENTMVGCGINGCK
ncbi:MAG: hypothetical protein ACRDDY_15500 [Clostridium sp.]|uniref:hypothetical protein n=1 Tax=Clostridium sp. TaxID=1506 RepID=UPI003EE49CB9